MNRKPGCSFKSRIALMMFARPIVQIFFAGLEDGPLPVGVRDDPEGVLPGCRGLVGEHGDSKDQAATGGDQAGPKAHGIPFGIDEVVAM